MTLDSNSENFYFSPNSILHFRKSYQIWGNWLKNKRVTGKNKTWGGKHPLPPVLIGSTRYVLLDIIKGRQDHSFNNNKAVEGFSHADNFLNCLIVTELPCFVYILVNTGFICLFEVMDLGQLSIVESLKTLLEMNWTDPKSVGYIRPEPIKLVYHRKQHLRLQKI